VLASFYTGPRKKNGQLEHEKIVTLAGSVVHRRFPYFVKGPGRALHSRPRRPLAPHQSRPARSHVFLFGRRPATGSHRRQTISIRRTQESKNINMTYFHHGQLVSGLDEERNRTHRPRPSDQVETDPNRQSINRSIDEEVNRRAAQPHRRTHAAQ